MSNSTASERGKKNPICFILLGSRETWVLRVGEEAGFRAQGKPIPARARSLGKWVVSRREREWPFPPSASIGPEGLRPRGRLAAPRATRGGCPRRVLASGTGRGLGRQTSEVSGGPPRAPPAERRSERTETALGPGGRVNSRAQVWPGEAAPGARRRAPAGERARERGPDAGDAGSEGGVGPQGRRAGGPCLGTERGLLVTESVFFAGTDRHELTSWKSFPSIFKFFTEASEAKTSSLKPALTRRSHRIKHEEL